MAATSETQQTTISETQQSNATAVVPTAQSAVSVSDSNVVAQRHEKIEPWTFVMTALVSTVIAGQPQPRTAAMTLSSVFKPVLDGWAATQSELRETKRQHEQARAHIARAQTQTAELGERNANLEIQIKSKDQSLAEAEGRLKAKSEEVRELKRVLEAKLNEMEAARGGNESKLAELGKKIAEAKAWAGAAIEGEKKARLEGELRKKEAELLRKRADEGNAHVQRLREEIEKAEKRRAEDAAKGVRAVVEKEAEIKNLQEHYRVRSEKVMALERQLQERAAEKLNLERRLAEVTGRRDALQQQLATFTRMFSRRG